MDNGLCMMVWISDIGLGIMSNAFWIMDEGIKVNGWTMDGPRTKDGPWTMDGSWMMDDG